MTQRPRNASATSTVTGGAPLTVAVTGAATGLGAAVAARLARSGHRVIGVDLQVGDLVNVEWRAADVREPSVNAALAGANAVVHLAVSTAPDADPAARRDLNARGTSSVLSAAAECGVAHAVLVTSTAVYGALPDNPVPLDEDSPLRAIPEGLVGDLLDIEQLGAQARIHTPSLRVSMVRPATLVGAGADSIATRHFASPRLLTVRDGHMRWQFVHADDVASAIEHVLSGDVSHDVITVSCDGWISQREAELISGKSSVEVPASVAFAIAERLHRAGLTPAPASELSDVVYPVVVTAQRLRASGWTPGIDNVTALHQLLADIPGLALAGRRVGRSEATIAGAGAAGATVAAVLGAAAFVRRARRARGL